ncbi:MAG TPA: efflux RND transporter periplasmic adaptor subunit [Phycisphaerales bacterium]|nr:efflux RND transporter periplasmic adaptor subunit [Phycisphaerales bacterium]HMP38116.1 efflux RND transporter periplasmic adaptor subunit [Phycisphaerales bacterium]
MNHRSNSVAAAVRTRRRVPLSQIVVALLAGATAFTPLAACKRIDQIMRRLEHSQAKSPEPPAIPVEVATVGTRHVDVYGTWVATITGSVDAAIRPRVSGYLLSRNYEEGSFVRSGALLFEIDPRPFTAALDQARATLARSQAEQAKTQLDVDRYTPLVAKRAVSQQELDDAIGNNNANLAQIKANEAMVVDAELNLSFTRVIAPIDGIIGMANAQIGDLVGPASPVPLTTMSTLDPLTVYFFPTEREYLAIAEKVAATAPKPMEEREARYELILADGSTFGQRGTFYFVDRQVDSRTGSIRVGLRFPNPGNVIRPGQFGKVRAVKNSIEDAVVVPERAIADVQGSFQVAVVGHDSTVEMRNVTIGPQDGADRVILDGLKAGETIVVEGIQKVRSGTKVAPQAAKPAAPAATPATGRSGSSPSNPGARPLRRSSSSSRAGPAPGGASRPTGTGR